MTLEVANVNEIIEEREVRGLERSDDEGAAGQLRKVQLRRELDSLLSPGR